MKQNLNHFLENFPILESEHLTLREIVPADLNDLAECITDVEMYTYWGDNRSTLEKNVTSYYKRFLERTPGEKRDCIYWGVALKGTDKIIGQVFINNIQNNRMAHFGYRITRAYWNNGYATEALQTMCTFCFTKTELKRIWSDVDIRNLASCRVLEKCNFAQEGLIRDGKMGRTYCDYYMYGYIKSDYKK